jgi:hypothetical protein
MKRMTKKDLAVGMYEKGLRVDAIAELLDSDPSYIANALIERGHAPNYVDLYTSTGPQNRYAAMLSGVLRFKNVEAARASVRRIGELYAQFEASRDRRGMHQCEQLALIGKNRAEGIGKLREARVFADWLAAHLTVRGPEAEVIQLTFAEPEEAPAIERQPLLLAA